MRLRIGDIAGAIGWHFLLLTLNLILLLLFTFIPIGRYIKNCGWTSVAVAQFCDVMNLWLSQDNGQTFGDWQ